MRLSETNENEAIDSPKPRDYEVKMPYCRIDNPMTELSPVRAREKVCTYGVLVAIGLRKHGGRGH